MNGGSRLLHRTDRGLRRRIRDQFRELDLQPPLSVELLCRRYGERRGRPIELHAAALPAQISGLTLVTADVDVIVYQRETTRQHQHWVTTHELGHIMLGHRGTRLEDGAPLTVLRKLMPHLTDAHFREALMRSCEGEGTSEGDDDERDERDAEATARLIRSWATVLDHVYPSGFDRATSRWVRGAFSERQGWL